jgi:hypothetical protein
MPVVSEESPKRRGRSLWPLWVAASVLFLLLGGVGLLPLTRYSGRFGNVSVGFYRDLPSFHVQQGYTRAGGLHVLRLGSWYWMLRVD